MFLNLEYESSYVARLINLIPQKKKRLINLRKIKFSKHFNYKQIEDMPFIL